MAHAAAAQPEKNEKHPSELQIELQTIHSGYDRKTCWVHPRAGMIPGGAGREGNPFSVVLTMHELLISGSDVFYPIHDMRTDDGGKTWLGPASQAGAFGRRPMPGGAEEGVCDFWPAWHAKSGVLVGNRPHRPLRWRQSPAAPEASRHRLQRVRPADAAMVALPHLGDAG